MKHFVQSGLQELTGNVGGNFNLLGFNVIEPTATRALIEILIVCFNTNQK